MDVKTQQPESSPNTLWVVATPLGHLDDLSPRAKHTLETADIVAAEDTRITQRLVTRQAHQRWVSLHEHNEAKAVADLIQALQSGSSVALVSDAGTPLISDPGFRLVQQAHQFGIRVSPVPGPSAAIAALSVAGLPSDRFHFEGFLPAKSVARQTRLLALASLSSTIIIYAPARDLEKVLLDMSETLGADRPVTLAREMTKHHETIRRSTVGDLHKWVSDDPNQLRGEAVLVVGGQASAPPAIDLMTLAVTLKPLLPPSKAAKLLANVANLSRQEAWDLVMKLDQDSSTMGSHDASED